MIRRILSLVSLVLVLSGTTLPQGSRDGESADKLKAAYIFNFIQFVEWPPRAFENDADTIVIGVFSWQSVIRSLQAITEGETISAHPLAVRELKELPEAKKCHVVVISGGAEETIQTILGSLRGSPTLTIGQAEGFAERGGAISLFVADNKLRFAINPMTIRNQKLRVSSKLLRLGTIVGEMPEEQ